MKQSLGRSMPARLALDLMDAGEPVVLAVLGMGVIENSGPDDDQRVADAYDDLATDDEPVSMVTEYYANEIEQHPWMEEPIQRLLTPLAKPTEDLVDKVRMIGRALRTQSIRGCEEWAEGDLLGRVSMNMSHLAARRKGVPGYNISPWMSTVDALMGVDIATIARMGSMTDLWAGSGSRAVGAATALRAVGRDPEQIRWRLMEADPMMRAIIALNCRAFDMGEQIEILDGSPYKQALLAAHADGMSPWLVGIGVDVDRLDMVPLEVREAIRDAL